MSNINRSFKVTFDISEGDDPTVVVTEIVRGVIYLRNLLQYESATFLYKTLLGKEISDEDISEM